MKLRVAIAGCHRMLLPQSAGHNFASAFAAVPETEIVAVYDRGPETRADFVRCWGEMPAYDDYARMLREVQPDLLCIATRQTLHAEQIEQAAAAGVRGILCDKPLATSLGEADRIVSACAENGIALTFALDRRWHESYSQLRRLIDEGIVGRVTSVLAFGCPNLINHGCHWYDTALLVMGDPELLWVSGWVDGLVNEPAESRRRLDPPGRGKVGLSNGVALSVTAGYDPLSRSSVKRAGCSFCRTPSCAISGQRAEEPGSRGCVRCRWHPTPRPGRPDPQWYAIWWRL